MIYRFVMVSDEVDDFLREIRIDSGATFLELHKAILASVGYSDDQMTSFFVSDKRWHANQEILLMDMGFKNSDEAYYLMDETYLDKYMGDPGDRLLYQFDQLGDRYFYLELKEVFEDEYLDQPQCTRRRGNAPVQTSDVEELLVAPPKPKTSVVPSAKSDDKEEDDLGFGTDEFDMSDLDLDGFDITEEG